MNIYRSDLARIGPGQIGVTPVPSGGTAKTQEEADKWATFLMVDPILPGNVAPWGWLGKGRTVSPKIVNVWLLNDCLKPYTDESGKEWPDCMVLTEFGMRCAAGQVKNEELRFPVIPDALKKPVAVDGQPEIFETKPGERLFTDGGLCKLCGRNMSIFGQISHAKGHVVEGRAEIVEMSKKKFARIVGRGETTSTTSAESVEGSGVAASKPSAPEQTGPASALFESEETFPIGTCTLCTKKLNHFGWISHAKTHINQGDPVSIAIVKGKKIPVVIKPQERTNVNTAERTDSEFPGMASGESAEGDTSRDNA